DYSLKKVFPEASQDDEEYLYQPLNIELAGHKLFVTDLGDCKVKVFDYESNYITSFGGSGNGLGMFTRPKGLSCDNKGNVYVVDAAFENIQIFNDEQELLLHFGGTYTGPGGMWLPADVCIDYNNFEYFSSYVDPGFKLEYLIYVSNQYGPDKISVYGFVGLTD
ncbi:MAG: 6-bladed beta-propeller, partial [Bacteroidales bacterium]|nr:6-bladed beta-propeller [Bacteroidales bacterium]